MGYAKGKTAVALYAAKAEEAARKVEGRTCAVVLEARKKLTYSTGFFAESTKPQPSREPDPCAPPSLVCAVCGSDEARQRCGQCKAVTYCGPECQEHDWWRHKRRCVPFDWKPTPALDQTTICPYCHSEVKMKHLGPHMDSDCGKHLHEMFGTPRVGAAPEDEGEDDLDEPLVEEVELSGADTVLAAHTAMEAVSSRDQSTLSRAAKEEEGPKVPPRRHRNRERVNKPVPEEAGGIEHAHAGAAGKENLFWDFVDEYPTTATGAMLMGWARHRHRAIKDEDLLDRPNRGADCTPQRATAATRHGKRVAANKQMIHKIVHACKGDDIFEMISALDSCDYWFTPREQIHWKEQINQGRALLQKAEQATLLAVTTEMENEFRHMRGQQARLIRAFYDEDRALNSKIRRTVEQLTDKVKHRFATEKCGSKGSIAG